MGSAQEMVNLYTKLARAGVGLIIIGHSYVHPLGKAERRMTGIHNDGLFPALKKLVNEAHRFETKIEIQINHSGGRRDKDVGEETFTEFLTIEYEQLGIISRAIDPEETKELIDFFAQAALDFFLTMLFEL